MDMRRGALFAALAINPVATAATALCIDVWMGARASSRLLAVDDERLPSGWAALVPGALCHADGSPRPALQDRLDTAVELYRAGVAPRVIVSGDDGKRRQDERSPMRDYLLRSGVQAADLVMDAPSYKTFDTLRSCAAKSLGPMVICTQRNHLARALYLADALGVQAVGCVADRRVYANALHDRLYEHAGRALAVTDVHFWERAGFGR